MIFNSLAFAVFLPIVAMGYFLTRGALRNGLLLAASYAFYGSWDWRFCGLLAITTVLDYSVGRRLESVEEPAFRRRLLLASVGVNLGILALFKYFDFFLASFLALTGSLGLAVSEPTARLLMPIGISFYTFKSLGYVIEVFLGAPAERSLLRYANFVAFFPQLSAGPIARGSNLLPQLDGDRRPTSEDVLTGVSLILWGLFKKIAIADSLASVVDGRFAEPTAHSALSLAVGVYFYAFQIYCDFSGYSDVAIGVARLLGFDTPLNFDRPYSSTTLAEFWNRWHISLSQWLRDFVFKPIQFQWRSLGMHASALAVVVTFLASGVWHGSRWTFVAWGALHGAALAVAVYLRPFDRWMKRRPPWAQRARRFLGIVVTFNFVCLTWIFFRSPDFATAASVLRGLSRLDGSFAQLPLRFLVIKGFLLIGVLLAAEFAGGRASLRSLFARYPSVRIAAGAALVWATTLFGSFAGQRFIYSQF